MKVLLILKIGWGKVKNLKNQSEREIEQNLVELQEMLFKLNKYYIMTILNTKE